MTAARQRRETKKESSNSQALKRPLSEENSGWLGGAFYTPAAAETRFFLFVFFLEETIRHITIHYKKMIKKRIIVLTFKNNFEFDTAI